MSQIAPQIASAVRKKPGPPHKNLTGMTIGTYIVLSRAERPVERCDRLKYFWNCKCEKCGVIKVLASSELKLEHGCLACRKLPNGGSAFNSLIQSYTAAAARRGLVFGLSKEVCGRLFKLPCAYCGKLPSQMVKVNSSVYIYNGIDRIDSTKGYILGNVAPCCGMCNIGKRDMPLDVFKEWIDRVHLCLQSPIIPISETGN